MTLAIMRSPGERSRDAKLAPYGAGEQHSNRTKRRGVLRARIYHWSRYGAPGEQ
jgi:hypothetical protein